MATINVDPIRANQFIERIKREAESDEQQRERKDAAIQQDLATSDHDPESWRVMSDWIVDFLGEKVCPAWQLESDEKAMFSSSLSEVLDQYFPGTLQGFDNWPPLAKLAGAACLIAVKRIDMEAGALAPMHTEKGGNDASSRSPGRTLDVNHGDDQVWKNASGFKTDGQ